MSLLHFFQNKESELKIGVPVSASPWFPTHRADRCCDNAVYAVSAAVKPILPSPLAACVQFRRMVPSCFGHYETTATFINVSVTIPPPPQLYNNDGHRKRVYLHCFFHYSIVMGCLDNTGN
jgi:hypothetical protein